jgi:hypothetical protein
VLVVFTPDNAVSHIEFTRAQFNHHIVPGQAVKQFTSTSCLHFRKKLKLLYMPDQRYTANYRRKDFMINHNESDLQSCPPLVVSFSPFSSFFLTSFLFECCFNCVICFLLIISQYLTSKYIFKIFTKISMNLKACCFKFAILTFSQLQQT